MRHKAGILRNWETQTDSNEYREDSSLYSLRIVYENLPSKVFLDGYSLETRRTIFVQNKDIFVSRYCLNTQSCLYKEALCKIMSTLLIKQNIYPNVSISR